MTDKKMEYSAVGRRKTSTANAILVKGTGKITINGVEAEQYFTNETSILDLMQPLELTGNKDKYDIKVSVKGGGLEGQTGAIRLAIAKALTLIDPENRVILREQGLLTRDPRNKERKKYGLKKARKAPQFSKR